MRLLVLTFYYAPDLSAGSFRATSLVKALRRQAPAGTEIDVLTTLPNRYHTFTQTAAESELEHDVTIRRIELPRHRSDVAGQARAFLRFASEAWRYATKRHYDVVFATSSRLMTAALGAAIARRCRAKLYLDIRDIFVDTIGDVFPATIGWPAKKIFSTLESSTIRRADRVNLVSRGFEGYFRARYGDRSFTWFTNGIDDEFLTTHPVPNAARPSAQLTILYAGNIGAGQCLDQVLPAMALALRGRARFVVIGDGGRRMTLEAAIRNSGVDNVEIKKPMGRVELIEAYRAADVLFVHLGDHKAFEKVLPSKLFEYGAMGKPILAGIAGYAAQFVKSEISNAAVFPPCDAAAGVRALASLELADRPRADFVKKYSRQEIARAMADDILNLA